MTDESFEKSSGDLLKHKDEGEERTEERTEEQGTGQDAPVETPGTDTPQNEGKDNVFGGEGQGGTGNESTISITPEDNPQGEGVPVDSDVREKQPADIPNEEHKENQDTGVAQTGTDGAEQVKGEGSEERAIMPYNKGEVEPANTDNKKNTNGSEIREEQVSDEERNSAINILSEQDIKEKERQESEERNLRNKYYAGKAKAFLSSLPVEDASSVADTYFRGARTLVNAMLLHPNAISSASRILGTAFTTAEATARMAANTAKKYSRVADKDPEIVKNTVMYKLYKRKQDQDKVAIENAYKTMDDALKQAGVEDYRQMTGDQLTDYLDILGKSRDSMSETLKKGTNPDGTPISREDRWLLKSQLDIVNEHADKVYKQYNRVSPYERKMDAEAKRQENARIRADRQAQRLAEKQAKIDAKNAEKQFYADQDAEKNRSWTEATDKTGYGDILRGAFGRPVELGPDGTPVNSRDANALRRYIADRKNTLEQKLSVNNLSLEDKQNATKELNRIKEYEQIVLRHNPHFSGTYYKQDALQNKLNEQRRIAGTVDRLKTSNPAVHNTLKAVYGDKPKEVDEKGIPVNAKDRARLYSVLSGANSEAYRVPEDYLLSLAGSIGPNALENLTGRIDKQKLNEKIKQSRENLRDSIKNFIEKQNNSKLSKIRFNEEGVPEEYNNRVLYINTLKKNPDLIPDLKERRDYMMKVAGEDGELKQIVNDYYIDQRRKASNIDNYGKVEEYSDVLKDVASADGDIDVDVDENGKAWVAPSSFKKLKDTIEDAIRMYPNDPKLQGYYREALDYFTKQNKILTSKAIQLGIKYGGVFEYIARVSPGFGETKIEEIIRNNNWGSAQAHTQIMKAVCSYIDELTKDVPHNDEGNPLFGRSNVGKAKAKNYKIAMAVQRAINLSDIKDDVTTTVRSYMGRYGWEFNTGSEEGRKLLAKVDAAYKRWMGPFGLNNIREFGEYDKDAFPDEYTVDKTYKSGKPYKQHISRSMAENAYKDEIAQILSDFIKSKMPEEDADEIKANFKDGVNKKRRTGEGRGKGNGKGQGKDKLPRDTESEKKFIDGVLKERGVLNPEQPPGETGAENNDATPLEGETGGQEQPVVAPTSKTRKLPIGVNIYSMTKGAYKGILDEPEIKNDDGTVDSGKLAELIGARFHLTGGKNVSSEMAEQVANALIAFEEKNNPKESPKEDAQLSYQEIIQRINNARKEGWLRGQKDRNQFNIYINRADDRFLSGLGKELSIDNWTNEKSARNALGKYFGLSSDQIKFVDDLNNIGKKGRRNLRTVPPKDENAKRDGLGDIKLDREDSRFESAILNGFKDAIDKSDYYNLGGANWARNPEEQVRYAVLYGVANSNNLKGANLQFLKNYIDKKKKGTSGYLFAGDTDEDIRARNLYEGLVKRITDSIKDKMPLEGTDQYIQMFPGNAKPNDTSNIDRTNQIKSLYEWSNEGQIDWNKWEPNKKNSAEKDAKDMENKGMDASLLGKIKENPTTPSIWDGIDADERPKFDEENISELDEVLKKGVSGDTKISPDLKKFYGILGINGIRYTNTDRNKKSKETRHIKKLIREIWNSNYKNSELKIFGDKNKTPSIDELQKTWESFRTAKGDLNKDTGRTAIKDEDSSDDAISDFKNKMGFNNVDKHFEWEMGDEDKLKGLNNQDIPDSFIQNAVNNVVAGSKASEIIDTIKTKWAKELINSNQNIFNEVGGEKYKEIVNKYDFANNPSKAYYLYQKYQDKLRAANGNGYKKDDAKNIALHETFPEVFPQVVHDEQAQPKEQNVTTDEQSNLTDGQKKILDSLSKLEKRSPSWDGKEDNVPDIKKRVQDLLKTLVESRNFDADTNMMNFTSKNNIKSWGELESSLNKMMPQPKKELTDDERFEKMYKDYSGLRKDKDTGSFDTDIINLIKKNVQLKDAGQVIKKFYDYLPNGTSNALQVADALSKALGKNTVGEGFVLGENGLEWDLKSDEEKKLGRPKFEERFLKQNQFGKEIQSIKTPYAVKFLSDIGQYHNGYLNPKYDSFYEFIKKAWNSNVPSSELKKAFNKGDDYSDMEELETKLKKLVKKFKKSSSVDNFLYEAWSKHDGSYEKLTSVLGTESFAKGGLMSSAKSLDDMYDIILHNVGFECAESFGRHFID